MELTKRRILARLQEVLRHNGADDGIGGEVDHGKGNVAQQSCAETSVHTAHFGIGANSTGRPGLINKLII